MENQTNDTTNVRPTVLTVICWLIFIGSVLAVIGIPFNYELLSNGIGSWYPPTMILLGIGGFVGGLGIYKMKKWGAYVYVGMQAVSFFIAYNEHMLERFGYISIIVSALFVGIVLFHLKKMTD